jgi:hypothetical protein
MKPALIIVDLLKGTFNKHPDAFQKHSHIPFDKNHVVRSVHR